MKGTRWECRRLAHCPLTESPHHQATLSLSTQVPLWDVRQEPKGHPGTAGTLLTHLHTRGHHPQASLGAPTSLFNSSWPRAPGVMKRQVVSPQPQDLHWEVGPTPSPPTSSQTDSWGPCPPPSEGTKGSLTVPALLPFIGRMNE